MPIENKVIVIGSGFAGLAAATTLAHKGYEVMLLEKNDSVGGRARKFEAEGFVFDMGPSWYWMPEVFENYFNRFDKKVADYYDLKRLDPSYAIIFEDKESFLIPAKKKELYALFEKHEPGSSKNLKKFLDEAQYKYEVGMNEFVFKPSHSILEFADLRILKNTFKLQLFQSMASHVRKLFKNPKLIKLLEFPVLFLGATPQNTPALYSLMNYADLSLGTWYPMGGMHKIIEGMQKLAVEKGVKIQTGKEVEAIIVEKGSTTGVKVGAKNYKADIIVAAADYHHVDQHLLKEEYRNYTEKYWDSRTMAPSSLLFYLGIDKKISKLHHHNLFFDEDFHQHAIEIYEKPQWPSKPLFYACCPSKTDTSVAPQGAENLFLLIPLAPDLKDSAANRKKYFDIIMDRLETHVGEDIRKHIVYKKSYAHQDFIQDYHAYKGNAYGLANTLLQTAFLKPKLRSKKVKNLFYTGQLSTPGPGVPPSLISGQVVAEEISKLFPVKELAK